MWLTFSRGAGGAVASEGLYWMVLLGEVGGRVTRVGTAGILGLRISSVNKM